MPWDHPKCFGGVAQLGLCSTDRQDFAANLPRSFLLQPQELSRKVSKSRKSQGWGGSCPDVVLSAKTGLGDARSN